MGFFSGESKLYDKASKAAGGSPGAAGDQYAGQRPGDIPSWSGRYEYDAGREIIAPDGNYYYALDDHNSTDSFAADLIAGHWQIFGGVGVADTITSFVYIPSTGILTITGSISGPWPVTINTLYAGNGTLAGARTVTMGGNNLTFSGTQDVVVTSTGRIGVNTAAPTTDVDINGDIRIRNLSTGLIFSDSLGNLYSGSGTVGAGTTTVTMPAGADFEFVGGFGTILTLDGDTGKVTIQGLLDPTGLQMTPVAANPGAAQTFWSNSTDGDRPYWDAANKFAFITDIPAPDGNGIYSGNGVVPAATVATVTSTFTFDGGTLIVEGLGIGTNLNQTWQDSTGTPIMRIRDDGRLGINAAPSTLNRVEIVAGSGLDGAINILASNVTDNGYGILVQGGTASANYFGIWSDVTVEGTGTNVALRGRSHTSGGVSNYGVYGSARNGSIAGESIGVYGIVPGGDAVNSSISAGGYFVNQSDVSTTREAVWAIGTTAVDNGTTYGVRSQVDANGVNAVNYGIHARANGNVASGTNYGGWFQADGGSGALNIGVVAISSDEIAILIPATGNTGILVVNADTASGNGSQVEVTGDMEVIGSANGLILESPDTTRWRVNINNLGALLTANA